MLAIPEPRRVRDGITPDLSPSLLTGFAAAGRQMPIISALRKAEPSAARLVTSSRSLYAAGTIAKSTGAAMKPPGGGMPGLTRRLRPVRY